MQPTPTSIQSGLASPAAGKHFHLELRGLLKSFAGMLGGQTLAALLQLATMVLVAHGWGPAGNGTYVVALLLPTMLANFLNLGVNAANAVYLGAARFPLPLVMRTNLGLWAVLGLIGLAAGAVLLQWRGPQMFPGIAPVVLWVALLGYPLALAQTYMASILQGLQRFGPLNMVMLSQPALMLFAVLALMLSGTLEVVWLVAANLLALLASLAAGMILLRRQLRLWRQAAPAAEQASGTAYLRQSLAYGHKAYLSNLLTLLQSRADIFLVNLLINPAAAGIYAIAYQLGEKIWMLSQAVSVVILPRLSGLEGNEARRIQITTIISRLVFAVSALAALAAGALAWPLIGLVFGQRYEDSYLPFVLLLPGIVALASARVIANDIAARGKPGLNLVMAGWAALVSIVGNLLVLPRFGMHGAAVVTSCVYIMDLVLKILVYRQITKAPFLSLVLLRASDWHDLRGALRRPASGA